MSFAWSRIVCRYMLNHSCSLFFLKKKTRKGILSFSQLDSEHCSGYIHFIHYSKAKKMLLFSIILFTAISCTSYVPTQAYVVIQLCIPYTVLIASFKCDCYQETYDYSQDCEVRTVWEEKCEPKKEIKCQVYLVQYFKLLLQPLMFLLFIE